jgi:hypothetical protein
MLPCGPGNVVASTGGFTATISASGPRRARFQGAYVEWFADGRLLHVLSHGISVSHAIAARGRLVAIGGQSESLDLNGKPDSAQPNFVVGGGRGRSSGQSRVPGRRYPREGPGVLYRRSASVCIRGFPVAVAAIRLGSLPCMERAGKVGSADLLIGRSEPRSA